MLLIVLGLAAAIPLYFAADQIRSIAPQASGAAAVFLALFTLGSKDISVLRVYEFVGIVAPLLGLAFAFDAVNGERSEGTLPRLLAQPIHRDDVINGKFVAGMAVIGLVLVTVVGFIAGFGMIRLGIVPHGTEVVRLIAWVAVTFLYVALWLAFGLLLSVLVRRAATAALIGFGIWLLVTIFGQLITTLVSGVLAPAADASADTILANAAAPAVHRAAAAEHALSRDLGRPAEPVGQPDQRTDVDRPGPAGAAADPEPVLARPELPARLAAGRRPGRSCGDLLRRRLRGVHAPGGPGLGARTADTSERPLRIGDGACH